MGKAEARDLGLDGGVLYDPVANYDRVHHRIWDWDSDPRPQAIRTGTAETPAQGAEVHDVLGPTLDTPAGRSLANTAGHTLSARPCGRFHGRGVEDGGREGRGGDGGNPNRKRVVWGNNGQG